MKRYMMRKAGGSVIVKNKIHRQQNKRICVCGSAALLAGILLAALAGKPAAAEAAEETGHLRSRGVLRCEEAVIDAADLQSIHAYVTEKKNRTAGILLQLGTKFWQRPEGIVCDRNPDSGQGDADPSQLGWPVLIQAAADSQKVPEGLTVLHPEAALGIEGTGESTDHYVTAMADNISRGKAAWADGRLLLGNGADNDRAYQAGIHDGEHHEVPDLFHPLFAVDEAGVEIRHVHTGGPAQTEGRSGCYQNTLSTHTETFVCGAELQQTGTDWRPNPDEPEGGSWHGGYYTCPNHGGLYQSPGSCGHEDIVQSSAWSHDLVCGLDGAVYAKLRVSGTDTDDMDAGIRLEAVLEEGGAFGRLSWQSEDRLVWTDDSGNLLGTGPELTVQTPGTYYCSINVNNGDIDKRTVGAAVRISGLLLKDT